MKKKIKTIAVDSYVFSYVIHENSKFVRLRVYSATNKTTYCDFYFTWKDNWLINFYKPRVAAKLIHYAIHEGWFHREEGQIKEWNEASFLIEQLRLEESES